MPTNTESVEPIFHIAARKDWEAAQQTGEYSVSSRGRTLDDVGFIHCSHRHQVERVANAAYRDAGPLVLLTIDPTRVDVPIREEAGAGIETFPHICGSLSLDAVIGTAPLLPGPGGLFVPSTSWLSPKLEVDTSSIEGLGLFAIMPIEATEPVAVMGGHVLTDMEFAEHRSHVERWSAAAIDENLNVLQHNDDPMTRGNHSCDPTLWMVDELTLTARRPIASGEEATVDYALMAVDESWSMECHCGCPDCRGVVTGADWRRTDLQSRYQGHFSPFIQRHINAARSHVRPTGR